MKKLTTHNKSGKQLLLTVVLFLIPVVGMGQDQPLADLIQQARAAGIEQSELDNIQNRAAARGISEAELMAIIRPAVALAGQNLPGELIFQKAMEGLSKGVPANQMSAVLQNIQQSTESIAPHVDAWMERGEVNEMLAGSGERFDRDLLRLEMVKVSSRAVSQQVGTELVRDLLGMLTDMGVIPTSKPSSVLAGISILPDLPEAAQRPDAAREIVVMAIQNGFAASDIQRLPGAMDMAQRRGQLPAAAVLEGVTQQIQGNLPASQILQNLFNGNIGGGLPGTIPGGLENRPGRAGQPANGR